MKKEIANKKCYLFPKIEQILLDNEMSLALESSPPSGPSEVNLTPNYLNNDLYRNLNS